VNRCVVLALAAFWLLACAEEVADRSPNIVLIIGDDIAFRDYGFMGSAHAKTPSLDELASEGLTFEQAFNTASVCRPSLQTLLSGLYPDQWAHRKRTGHAIQTLPSLLSRAGYASFQGGKLWEGSFADAGFSEGMTRGGSDTSEQRYGRLSRAGGEGIELGRSTMQPVEDFLRDHRDEPFFLWFAPMLPHAPHDAPSGFEEPYLELSTEARGYFANLSRFDSRVGELLRTIDQLGLREDTMVVYLADNGWEQDPRDPSHRLPYGGPRGKASMSELGFRTPIVVRWPGRTVPGRRSSEVVSTVDLFPTLLGAAGVEVPPGPPGVDLGPLLRDAGAHGPERAFGSMRHLRSPGVAGSPQIEARRALFVRTPEWRYVFDAQTGRGKLFRIGEDPEERTDLSKTHPDVARELRARLSEWQRSTRVRDPRTRAAKEDSDGKRAESR